MVWTYNVVLLVIGAFEIAWLLTQGLAEFEEDFYFLGNEV